LAASSFEQKKSKRIPCQNSLVPFNLYVADLLVLLNSTGDQFEQG